MANMVPDLLGLIIRHDLVNVENHSMKGLLNLEKYEVD